jgi:hypothetical protein
VDWPLAMMDFQTLDQADMHPCDLWRNQFEERGQTVTFTHNPDQHWYYLDKHRVDEVSIIKIWDSKDDGIAKSKLVDHHFIANPNKTQCVHTPLLLIPIHQKVLLREKASK